MDFQILRSRKDPEFYIITDVRNYQRAMQEYQDSQPGDELVAADPGSEQRVLDTIPNLSVVRSFIDLIGYFGHAVEASRAWPTSTEESETGTG